MNQNKSSPSLIVYKGPSSQTGIAFKSKFPDVLFDDNRLGFDEINTAIQEKSLIASLPIWNSHAGEVTISHALSMLFNEQARLYYLWPEKITFECLTKPSNGELKRLISVSVAEQQCSKFILDGNYEFIGKGSSVEAYEIFKTDKNYVAVLRAPATNVDGYSLLTPNAANSINFTTFGLLGSYDSDNWPNSDWGNLSNNIFPTSRVFTAIQMPINSTLTESQEELFDNLVEDAASVEDIPKILFVSRHDHSKCRLLLEGATEISPDIINESGANSDIKIISNIGYAKDEYSKKAYNLIEDMLDISEYDFIEHVGHNTCFYACPALGIITHGFEKEATELIVRHLIKKHFELLSQLGSSDLPSAAERLFQKYKIDFQTHGKDFIKFIPIGLN